MSVSIKALVEQGNIVTTQCSHVPGVGRYQGNGQFGGVYSRLGLHAHPDDKEAFDLYGFTQFTHLRHWGRFAFYSESMQADTTADYLLPLARIYWEKSPEHVENDCQTQSFYDGTIATNFRCHGGSEIGVTTWFDPVHRDLAAVSFHIDGPVSPIILSIPTGFRPYSFGYNEPTEQTFTASREGDQWEIEITCLVASPPTISKIYVLAKAHVEACVEGLKIYLPQGVSEMFISYGEPVDAAVSAGSLSRTKQFWHDTWENSAWFAFPEEDSQKMWIRSLAYILSSFNDGGVGFSPTNGFTGNPFPFNFAQDLFYVHPVLLAAGHVRIAKAWIESFLRCLDGMKAYAKQLWPEVDGIYPPWELPYGPIEGYHAPSVPIFYCYEPHNAAYLARMAHETGLLVDVLAWTQANVVPLIRETALFYKSFCKKEADGHWHLFLTPSIGQDEAGGRNQKDYLCALYGAKYSFQRAIEYELDEDGTYQRILADELAFASLLSPHGFYYTSAGSGQKDFGQQKHPVQLNGLAYLPVEPQSQPAEQTAHRLRYEITTQADEPKFFGWTLGEFLLASSRLHNVNGWRQDWENVRPSHYTDEDWVQLYETSGATRQSFYVTTHGLFAQSLITNIASDYWGKLQIAPCPVYSKPVQFGNVRSLLGVKVAGEITNFQIRVTLEAWKDCTFEMNERQVTLKKGETKDFVCGVDSFDGVPQQKIADHSP